MQEQAKQLSPEAEGLEKLPETFFTDEEIYNQTRQYQAHMGIENPEKNILKKPKKQSDNARIMYRNRPKNPVKPIRGITSLVIASIILIRLLTTSVPSIFMYLDYFIIVFALIALRRRENKIIAFGALAICIFNVYLMFYSNYDFMTLETMMTAPDPLNYLF